VLSFEPNPRLNQILGLNVAVNGFWHTVETRAAAIGARSEAGMPFLALPSDPKNGHLFPGAEEATLAAYEAQGYVRTTVPVQSLDDALEGPVHFAKIDVEGAEEAAWTGMQRLLARSPDIRLVLEFNPARCRQPAETLAAIGAMFPLRRIGFDGRAVSCTAADVLGETEDTILYLSRHDAE
jgi:FkbM family methyltransferase